MRSSIYLPIWFALTMAILFSVSQAQSGSSSVDTPAVPAHSGSAAGENGPKVSGPPPARQSTNPVNSGEHNSPRRIFSGVVSDSFCGQHHYMLQGANDAECTRYCIAHQRDYVLVVGDRLYTLKNRPGRVLDALAGEKAQVTGALVGTDVLEVNTVNPIEGQK